MPIKKHIAFITHGGIGSGEFSQGIPILNSFLQRLLVTSQVTVFSFYPVNKAFEAKDFLLISPKKELSFLNKIIWLFQVFKKQNSKNKIDIIHAFWGYPSGFISQLIKLFYKVPNVIHLQGGDSTAEYGISYGIFLSKHKKLLAKWVYARANQLVVLTHFQNTKLSEHLRKKTAIVIPFGIDQTVFYLREKRPINSVFQLLHIAHLNKVKDQKTLLDTHKEICKNLEAHLTILGGDTLNGELHNYAREIGLKNSVTFIPFMPHSHIVKYLRQADLLLHTSLYEAQGLVISEALACGVPVCGTKVGLISDLADKCTIASPIGNSKALAKNAIELLQNNQKYQDLVAKGAAWSAKHDINWTVNEFERVYQHLTNGR